jgi:hypothetical protein
MTRVSIAAAQSGHPLSVGLEFSEQIAKNLATVGLVGSGAANADDAKHNGNSSPRAAHTIKLRISSVHQFSCPLHSRTVLAGRLSINDHGR